DSERKLILISHPVLFVLQDYSKKRARHLASRQAMNMKFYGSYNALPNDIKTLNNLRFKYKYAWGEDNISQLHRKCRPVKTLPSTMQRQGKPVPKESSCGNIKWWILVGVLAFISVCAFIGVTLWLGLNLETVEERRIVKTKDSSDQETPSARTDKKQQVVFGATTLKTVEDTPRRNQKDNRKGEKGRKEEDDVTTAAATTTTTTTTTSTTTEVFQGDKDNIEEAIVQEVSKEQSEAVTTVAHSSQSSGSPLYPQPIPETPPFMPIAPAEHSSFFEAATATDRKNATVAEPSSTPGFEPMIYTTIATETEKETDFMHHIFHKQEENPDFLDSFFNTGTTHEDYSKHGRPTVEDDSIRDLFLGDEDKDMRRYDIVDLVNEKGEHFMPQHFEYPHDRDHPAPEPYQRPPLRGEPYIRHSGEVYEDGVDREGLPSLDPEALFYSPGVPERYDGEDPDLAENPFTTFLQGRLQELYSWLSTDEDLQGKQHSGTSDNSTLSEDLMTLLLALNQSMNEGNSSILLGKLKEMYYNESKLNVTDPALLHNSSSLVSFGLLAFDLLLLRNVQQIAWEEEKVSKEEMLQDPEVLALNALFMSPEKVRQLQEPQSRVGKESKDEDTNKTIFQEIMEFLNGSLRAVLNLGRAYRRSISPSNSTTRPNSNTIDCIWTLYCRNLDKTAQLHGPYGFLAKMNSGSMLLFRSLGLRLVMGEFPVENALDQILKEVTLGWSHMDCEKLFPRYLYKSKKTPKHVNYVFVRSI
ncbi:hypothetical protein C0J52_27102, partial [Blattella germanica]